MDRGWGSFRTTGGEAVVGDDAVRIHRTPKKRVRGLLARGRHSSRRDRAVALFRSAALLSVPLWVATSLYARSDLGTTSALLLSVFLLAGAVQLGQWWTNNFQDVRIPLSAIEQVVLDADARELTIAHQPGATGSPSGPSLPDEVERFLRTVTGGDPTETTLTLPATEDVREARSAFRTRGVEVADPEDDADRSETVHRVETHDGVVLCERCGTQVSPADRRCSACGYAIQIERPAGNDGRERSPALE